MHFLSLCICASKKLLQNLRFRKCKIHICFWTQSQRFKMISKVSRYETRLNWFMVAFQTWEFWVVAFCWNSLLSDVFKNGKASEKLSTSSWLASSWHPLLNEANKPTKIRTFMVPKTTTQTKGSSRPERLQLCCFHAWFPSDVSSSSPQADTTTVVVVEHY